MKIALYPGSFDPITNGHLDIIKRSARLFDQVVVLVSINGSKKAHFDSQTRVKMIVEAVADFKNVTVAAHEGLTVTYAKQISATHLIRGIRAVSDYEYELRLFTANSFADHSIDTVFFMSDEKYSNISSSFIMELNRHQIDISSLVPMSVLKQLRSIKD